MNRSARAVAVGAAAALTYAAGSRVREVLPVRPGLLALVATVGTAAVFSGHASGKAYEVEATVADMLLNGFTVGGRVDIQGGNLHLHGNNVDLEGGSVRPVNATGNGPVTWRVVGELQTALARVEEHVAALRDASSQRGTRAWLLVTAFAAPVVSTLVVTAMLTWLHLREQVMRWGVVAGVVLAVLAIAAIAVQGAVIFALITRQDHTQMEVCRLYVVLHPYQIIPAGCLPDAP